MCSKHSEYADTHDRCMLLSFLHPLLRREPKGVQCLRNRWDKFPSNVKIQLRGREQELVDSRGEESFFKEDCIESSRIGALDFCCESSNAIDMATVCSVT